MTNFLLPDTETAAPQGSPAAPPSPSPSSPTAAASLQEAVRARFQSDLALQKLLSDKANLEAAQQELLTARKALNDALAVKAIPPPPEEIREGNLGGRIFGITNPEFTTWQKQQDDADAVIADYYEGRFEGVSTGKPSDKLKELQTKENQYRTATQGIDRQISSRQQELQDAVTKESKLGSAIVQVPVEGRPGVTQPSVYDPNANGGAGGYVPAKDGNGNPLPVNITGGPELSRAGKPKEGSQSWTLKEYGGEWYNVPTVADAAGEFVVDSSTGRLPVKVPGLSGRPNLQVIGGMPYTLEGNQLTPVQGYSKPPIVAEGADGKKYYSTDDGKSWQAAQGLPGKPQTLSSGGYVYPLDENGMPLLGQAVQLNQQEQTQVVDGFLVRYDPNTKQVERTDLYTPEQRARAERTAGLTAETAGVNLETARANLARSQQLQDPVAEYQRQVGLLQTSATQYRDDLNDKIMRGELSVEDANRQFDGWWGTNVEAKLQPYQTMAEASYRKEQNDYQTKVAAEQARVDAINRQREQLGYQAGETARAGLNALAPSARSPEFLAQFAQNVSNIGKPLPGGPSQHSGGMQFSPESLSLENVRRAMPNLTEVGQNAAARALASISPAAAQSVGAPPPQVPGLPQFQDYMNKAPFQIPNPALPIPGRAALDLGSSANAGMLGLPVQPGYAATQYQGGRIEPWQIPG